MEGLIYLIPVALLLGLAGLGAFLWALKSGQFDDLDGAAERILLDEEDAPHPEAPESKVETTAPAEPPRRS
jgi:cbb3-type cytochrome oxidase maturation protein